MNKHLIKYLASLLIFGTNGIVASMTLMASSDIVVSRVALGLALLASISLTRRASRKKAVAPFGKDTLLLLLSGAVMGGGWICLFEAYSRIGVSVSTLLYYCGPIVVMALSPILFKEKLNARRALCFTAVLAGSCLVGGYSYALGMDSVGLVMGMGAALSYALMVILGKKATGIEGVNRAVLQLAGALVAVVALRAILGEPLLPVVPFEGIPWILLLGLVSTGLGCYLYFAPLPQLKSQTVAVCGYLEPLSATVFAAMILGETLGAAQIVGGILIIGGAVLFDLAKSKGLAGRNSES